MDTKDIPADGPTDWRRRMIQLITLPAESVVMSSADYEYLVAGETAIRHLAYQLGEVEQRLASAAEEIRELERRSAKLTVALNFWMPGVPADDPEVATRVSEDAGLLVQTDLVSEKSAEELGWIRLRPTPLLDKP